ncbi:cytochrome c-type biogenesis CcmF C-terminal domain-containing protein [Shigella flexneri]
MPSRRVLLGTFRARSRVLVSVDAFASDRMRYVIFAFMVLAIGGSLLLFAARGHKVRWTCKQSRAVVAGTSAVSEQRFAGRRDVAGITGTPPPLVHKQLGLGSISIGEPWSPTPCLPG